MPLINHVRGDQVPDSMLNVRTPIVHLPLWMVVLWWTVKGLARLVYLACRYWYVTGPAVLLLWLYARFGWWGPAGLVAGLAGSLGGWGLGHRPSFVRFGWYPALSRVRRWQYRRRWYPAMATAKLTVRFDNQVVMPSLRRVRCGPGVETLTVRMVTGQIPDDFARVSERLCHTFDARSCRVTPGPRSDLVVLTLLRGDPLAAIVAPLPVPAVPDFMGLPVALLEGGAVYRLRLFGTQILIVGATGAGKGSALWSILAAMAGGIRAGIVRVWGFDPNGGMEMAMGRPLLDRFFCDDVAAMATALEDLVAVMQGRQARLRGDTRQHQPTVAEPLYVAVIDELAVLTAYLTDRAVRDRIKAALGLLLTQGRKVGVHVVAFVQDPRKEVLAFRDLFPTRIALRLTEASQVDLVLGDGARDRGALCDRIPMSLPGVGYVVLDGDPTPLRLRFSFWSDEDITTLARDYGRLRLIGSSDSTEGASA